MVVTELSDGTNYTMRVRAKSAGGWGAWGDAKTVRTQFSHWFCFYHEDGEVRELVWLPACSSADYDPGKKKDIPEGKAWVLYDRDGDERNYWNGKRKNEIRAHVKNWLSVHYDKHTYSMAHTRL
jgi:hypothetical protein